MNINVKTEQKVMKWIGKDSIGNSYVTSTIWIFTRYFREREREKVRERESTMNIRDEYVSQLHQLNDSDFKNISSNYVFSNV